jgi:hypothetical protein
MLVSVMFPSLSMMETLWQAAEAPSRNLAHRGGNSSLSRLFVRFLELKSAFDWSHIHCLNG